MGVRWRDRLPELDALIEGGALRADLCAHFGCSENALHQALSQYGRRLRVDAVREQRAAFMRSLLNDPEKVARGKRVNAAAKRTPEYRLKRAAIMRENWKRPEFRARQVELQRQRMLAKSVDERRAMALKANAARNEAKRAAEAEAARLAAMTPWERTLERAKRVGIIERPVLVANDREYSLTGCGLAL